LESFPRFQPLDLPRYFLEHLFPSLARPSLVHSPMTLTNTLFGRLPSNSP
jgi:hypothetical protein